VIRPVDPEGKTTANDEESVVAPSGKKSNVATARCWTPSAKDCVNRRANGKSATDDTGIVSLNSTVPPVSTCTVTDFKRCAH